MMRIFVKIYLHAVCIPFFIVKILHWSVLPKESILRDGVTEERSRPSEVVNDVPSGVKRASTLKRIRHKAAAALICVAILLSCSCSSSTEATREHLTPRAEVIGSWCSTDSSRGFGFYGLYFKEDGTGYQIVYHAPELRLRTSNGFVWEPTTNGIELRVRREDGRLGPSIEAPILEENSVQVIRLPRGPGIRELGDLVKMHQDFLPERWQNTLEHAKRLLENTNGSPKG